MRWSIYGELMAFVIAWPGKAVTPGTSPTTDAVDTTGANFVAVVVTCGVTLNSVTDNKSNTYTLLGPFQSGTTDNVYLAYTNNASAATVGSGHTITANITGSVYVSVSAAAYSGMATSGVLDKSANAGGTGTALDSGNTSTTTQADELIVGGGTVDAGDAGWTAGSGFTIRSSNDSLITPLSMNYLEDRTVSSTGAYNAPATAGQSGAWEAVVATFKLAAGGGSVTTKTAEDVIAVADANVAGMARNVLTSDAVAVADSTVAGARRNALS